MRCSRGIEVRQTKSLSRHPQRSRIRSLSIPRGSDYYVRERGAGLASAADTPVHRPWSGSQRPSIPHRWTSPHNHWAFMPTLINSREALSYAQPVARQATMPANVNAAMISRTSSMLAPLPKGQLNERVSGQDSSTNQNPQRSPPTGEIDASSGGVKIRKLKKLGKKSPIHGNRRPPRSRHSNKSTTDFNYSGRLR